MTLIKNLFCIFITTAVLSCSSDNPIKLLVFSKTTGFRHASIETGKVKIEKIANEQGWEVTFTEDDNDFTEKNLQNYSAVIWLNTTGDPLDYWQQADFERYIQSGGGFVGIHSATDTEYDWGWYNQLVGAYFLSHPHIQEAVLNVNRDNPITSKLPDSWTFTDEWYNFRDISNNIEVLISIDEGSYEGGKNGKTHPMVWIQKFDGGQSFYTGLGHQIKTWEDELFISHITEGIKYSIGDNKRDYSKVRSVRPPEENRFARTILLQNLTEPMELDFIAIDKLLFIERQGNLKEYDLLTGDAEIVANIDVFSGLEEGLLGLAVDPNYQENNWIYLFHSKKENPVQHLSRFEYKNKQLNLSSEKVLLEVEVMRGDACCHSGGSIEFGPDGLLYLSTGDNTNPFESAGYAPMDERPGRAAWDAQKSAANSNDLRGKIIRIRPTDDGSYEIPDGNLFEPGMKGTRPEIYIMGLRNPFRISVDPKNSWLYWGDVGPDAGTTNPVRGSKGLDELNQARRAGFYGWPYSRGNNTPYNDFDFTKNVSGDKIDLKNPVNDSPNNTGIKDLPEINPSLIWYSYDKSSEFPWVGTGGKNPMAGPVFYSSVFSNSEKSFPKYFDGKVFFYDWMRDWIFLIGLDSTGNYSDAMPFMPNSRFNNPMDMVFGSDGSLYILEYGENWKTQNLDARLNRIEFIAGNRPPVAQIKSDKIVGAAPLEVNLTGEFSKDYDNDELEYTWTFEDNSTSNGLTARFTFTDPGKHHVSLTVKDKDGLSSISTIEIIVGNDPPDLSVSLEDDNQFFWDNRSIDYKVEIRDREDGNSNSNEFNLEGAQIAFSYIPEGEDLASLGHQVDEKPTGLTLIEGSDCKACHGLDKKVNGPSYVQISDQYTESNREYLADKIIDGGSGVWGENMMSAHPQLDKTDVFKMVDYILSTSVSSDIDSESLPLVGKLVFDKHLNSDGLGKYAFITRYTDQGNENIAPLTDQEITYFYPAIRQAEEYDEASDGISVWNAGGTTNLGMIQDGKHVMFRDINIAKLSAVKVRCFYVANYDYAGDIELRIDSSNGQLIGKQSVGYNSDVAAHVEEKIMVDPVEGTHNLYFVFRNDQDANKFIANIDWVYFGYQ